MKRILAVGAIVLLLSGCFGTPATPDPTPEPDFAGGSSRTPALAISCDELAPINALRELYGEDLAPVPYREAGAQGSWTMQATALLQDGALACAWAASPGARPEVVILALDDAVDGYERSEPSFLQSDQFDYRSVDIADAGQAFCREGTGDNSIQCHWNVLVDDVWMSFYFGHVAASEVDDELRVSTSGSLGDVVDSAIQTAASAERNRVNRVEPTLAPCSETLTQESVALGLGVPTEGLGGAAGRPLEYALGSSNPTFGQVMWAYSYERLGYTECSFGVEALQGSAIVAPGAAWILTEPGAIQAGITSIGGLGSGTRECLREGSHSFCSVAVAVGQDLALVQMVSPDEAAAAHAALEIARLLLVR